MYDQSIHHVPEDQVKPIGEDEFDDSLVSYRDCLAIWRSVIVRAFWDISSLEFHDSAVSWFGSSDFRQVCELADVTPIPIYRDAMRRIELFKLGKIKEARAGLAEMKKT